MKKLKLFIENFIIYGFGGVISKIIPLIMVPIITRMMPDSTYFGISDLSNTLVSIASALAVMGMYDAMFRLFFEKEDKIYKEKVCSTALFFTLCTSATIFILLSVFKGFFADFFFGDKKYGYLVYISAIAMIVGSTNNIVAAPTRMQNKRMIYLVTNILSSVLSYAVSIPLLIKGYYTIALPVASACAGIVIEMCFFILNRKWFSLKRIDCQLLRQLLHIAIPLFPNFLIYWVFNSADRLMITNMLGIDSAGVYSVGAKLGHASQLIYTAFAGGWQYFAYSTMKDKEQVEANSLIYEYLATISFFFTSLICIISYPLYKFLFVGEYVDGYIVSPYLFLAPLLQMLFQIGTSQFLITKKTWPNLIILVIGATLNVLFNYILIPYLEIEGAAIATLIGYATTVIISVIVLSKMRLMKISRRLIASSIIFGGFFCGWRVYFNQNILFGTICIIVMSLLYISLYKKDIVKLKVQVKEKKNDNAK